MKIICFLMSVLFLLGSSVGYAKDLSKRLGVGYSNQFSMDLPSMSAHYYPNPDMAFSAALGLDTEKDASKFGLQVRLDRVIFSESNMNFYMGAAVGLITKDTLDDGEIESESGFELSGLVGAEFFLQGLDSLGFRFDFGVGVSSLKSGVRFRTIGDSPMHAGIVFYF